MKIKVRILAMIMVLFLVGACSELTNIKKSFSGKKSGTAKLSNADITKGLKAALQRGIKLGIDALSGQDGYQGDLSVKILFPASARKAEKKLRKVRMGSLVDKFVKSMNRGAERGVKEALTVFVNAIKNMSVADARNILFGDATAATDYFKRNTREALLDAFRPHIRRALKKVGAIKLWRKVTKAYNRVTFRKKINTDIVAYATDKALDGLFLKVAEVEKKIRKNPAARVTAILKKVFSKLDNR